MQFTEFSDLGYKGFGVAFKGSKVQLVGDPMVLKAITPPVFEYLHALVTTGKLCFKILARTLAS